MVGVQAPRLIPAAGESWPAQPSLGPAAEIPALCTAQLAGCQSCASPRLGSGKWGMRRAYGQEARKYRAKGWMSALPRDENARGTSPAQPCPAFRRARRPKSRRAHRRGLVQATEGQGSHVGRAHLLTTGSLQRGKMCTGQGTGLGTAE